MPFNLIKFVLLAWMQIICLNQIVYASGSDDFIFTVDTTNTLPGGSMSNQFLIYTFGYSYKYSVDCDNDGTFEKTNANGDYTCNYTSSGIHTIRIEEAIGDGTGFPRLQLNFDKEKIISIDQWGTFKWVSMHLTFSGCVNMAVNANDPLNLTNLTVLSNMFSGAIKANPDTSNWDVSSVIYMDYMFYNASSANPDTSNWQPINVITMAGMFQGAMNANPDTSSWDVSSVENMGDMFSGAIIANPDISNWDTSSVINMTGMFDGAINANPVTDGNLWNTAKVINMARMFKGAISADPSTKSWDVSKVLRMESMFEGATVANPIVEDWITDSLERVDSMFKHASNANPNVTNWNTASIVRMDSMFEGAISANPNVGSWNTSSVIQMGSMFKGAIMAMPVTNTWTTTLVEDMSNMFEGAIMANPITGGWNVSSVIDMSYMFNGASNADPNTSSWITNSLVNVSGMFQNAVSANPTTSSWNTSLVTNMSAMFSGATSSVPDTTGWDFTQVTDMTDMFLNIAIPRTDYDNLLVNINSQNVKSNVNFNGGNSEYCSINAQNARANIIATKNWVISDGNVCPLIAPNTAPDMSASSDTGESSIDNVTAELLPIFNVECTSIENVLRLYTNKPASNTTIATHQCTTIGSISLTPTFALPLGVQSISYREENSSGSTNNSPLLNITILPIPSIPFNAPDLDSLSDTGSINNDDITSNGTPSFNVKCSNIGNKIILLTDKPILNTEIGIHTCNSNTIELITSSGVLEEGIHHISYKDQNISGDSGQSPVLPIIIDLTAPQMPEINPIGTSFMSITGTSEPNSLMIINGAMCTNNPVITDLNGNWQCLLNSSLSEGTSISITATDTSGNQSIPSNSTVIATNVAPTFNVFCDIDATDVTGGNNSTIQMNEFLNNIILGPSSESNQTFTSSIQILNGNDPDLIVNNISINGADLFLDINLNSNGMATVDVSIQDNGGTLVGGIDTTSLTFNIYHFADLNLDPNLPMNDILYKNTFDPCRAGL